MTPGPEPEGFQARFLAIRRQAAGHDELAQDWGLAVGLRPIELLQTLERQRLLAASPAA